MPTILSHPAPVLALAAGLGAKIIPPRLAAVALAASILPDLDVVSFKLGISYAASWGHRGFSHSLLFVLLLGGLGALFAPRLRSGRLKAFAVIAGAGISHILLDAMTTGGLGVAVFWPFDDTRYFLPWRPVAVSPIGIRRFFSEWGLRVMLSELQWIWLPCAFCAFICFIARNACGREQKKTASSGPAAPLSAAAERRVICPSRSGRHAGRCPCPYTGKGLRPDGCAYLKEEP